MKKLTQQEILNLQPNENWYYIKLWRLFDPKPQLIYEGFSQLHIQRANSYKKLPERLSLITPKVLSWAEASYNDVFDDGDIVVEDYQMEIFTEEPEEVSSDYLTWLQTLNVNSRVIINTNAVIFCPYTIGVITKVEPSYFIVSLLKNMEASARFRRDNGHIVSEDQNDPRTIIEVTPQVLDKIMAYAKRDQVEKLIKLMEVELLTIPLDEKILTDIVFHLEASRKLYYGK